MRIVKCARHLFRLRDAGHGGVLYQNRGLACESVFKVRIENFELLLDQTKGTEEDPSPELVFPAGLIILNSQVRRFNSRISTLDRRSPLIELHDPIATVEEAIYMRPRNLGMATNL
jgi:hypothetical protein